MRRIIRVMIIIAQPSECPGRYVISPTKVLYIGRYTTSVKKTRNTPGVLLEKVTNRSPTGVFRVTIYFPLILANTFARSSNGRRDFEPLEIVIELQKAGASFSIPEKESGFESIDIERS